MLLRPICTIASLSRSFFTAKKKSGAIAPARVKKRRSGRRFPNLETWPINIEQDTTLWATSIVWTIIQNRKVRSRVVRLFLFIKKIIGFFYVRYRGMTKNHSWSEVVQAQESIFKAAYSFAKIYRVTPEAPQINKIGRIFSWLWSLQPREISESQRQSLIRPSILSRL